MDSQTSDSKNQDVVENKSLSISHALIPVVLLVAMLAYNVFVFGDSSLNGSNQFILLMGAAVAVVIGFINKVPYKNMVAEVSQNVKSTSTALLILLMVGALSGTWLISGIIPTMIYYGLQVLNPTIFLAACVVICAVLSISIGSSWTTSATVGIALIGIANALDISLGMTAGAILSGAYFGDKLSPLSDTTNLAPAMAGTDLFTHIRYMTYTTIPSFVVALVAFIIIGFTLDSSGQADTAEILAAINERFFITPWLFLVPAFVIFLIVKKTPPLIALLSGTLVAAVLALILQPDLILIAAEETTWNLANAYKGVMNAITVDIKIPTNFKLLEELFIAGGMAGMLPTIWLILCAMVFGGVMDAIGALAKISESLLKLFTSTFGLFASTVSSCLAINLTASDQYLAIVVPGKMFAKAYEEKGLAPENLSRTLEDAGTVTSVLIPWNTCGAYHSGVLGVPVADYFIYAIFNYVSPFMTLLFAAFNIKIRQLKKN
ncbi:Na+/H+ antiporter NhaC [Psychroflexus planctonicus]|uniref:Sodium:proton antiporter n=1 Tax=Psychroflexus planctonicus TaxID=1526575 RepID=A0ABQ1SF24_9FLAO|nr:Na+/H+ antiporter NhaC [Psychroflexus planctonicus]GGE32772.1 sodium:proton antiporter [Psychroflexus planctonicus]